MLRSSKEVPKRNLIFQATLIAAQKMRMGDFEIAVAGASAKAPGERYIVGAALIEHLEENVIEYRLSTLCLIDDEISTSAPVLALSSPTMGEPLNSTRGGIHPLKEYNPQEHRIPGLFGTASGVGLFVAYLQSPCDNAHANNSFLVKLGESANKPATQVVTNVVESPTLQPSDIHKSTYMKPEAKAAIFTFYEMTTEYVSDHNTIMMPLAGDGSTVESPNQDTAVFIDVARPTQKRLVKISAQRIGEWPEMPQQKVAHVGPVKVVPIGVTRLIGKPRQITTDGVTSRYELDFEYLVGLSRPLDKVSIPMGSLPWDSTKVDDAANKIPQKNFIQSIIQ